MASSRGNASRRRPHPASQVVRCGSLPPRSTRPAPRCMASSRGNRIPPPATPQPTRPVRASLPPRFSCPAESQPQGPPRLSCLHLDPARYSTSPPDQSRMSSDRHGGPHRTARHQDPAEPGGRMLHRTLPRRTQAEGCVPRQPDNGVSGGEVGAGLNGLHLRSWWTKSQLVILHHTGPPALGKASRESVSAPATGRPALACRHTSASQQGSPRRTRSAAELRGDRPRCPRGASQPPGGE
jgi:hypothetical protein